MYLLKYSQIEDCVASLKDFCTTSTNRLLTQCLLHKYKSKAEDNKIYTQNLPLQSQYVTIEIHYVTNKLIIEHQQKDQT